MLSVITKCKVVNIFIGIVCLLLMAACHHNNTLSETQLASEQEQWVKVEGLNRTADELYRFSKNGQYTEARGKLQMLSEQIVGIRFTGIASLEGANALGNVILEAVRIYNAIQIIPEDAQLAAARVRLATDALTHREQPMWLQYQKIMSDHFLQFQKAADQQNKQEALSSLEQLFKHYQMIRTAALITRDQGLIEKADTLFVFMNDQFAPKQVDYSKLKSSMTHLGQLMEELFGRSNNAAYLPMMDDKRPLLWTLSIASLIIAALAYTGWRMYWGESKIVSIRDKFR